MNEPLLCPACRQPMLEEDFGDALVDVCASGCQGIWFDRGELDKLERDGRGGGPALARALSREVAQTPGRDLFDCPRCSTRMARRPHGPGAEVNVDECEQCGAVFLDSGELARLRMRVPARNLILPVDKALLPGRPSFYWLIDLLVGGV